MLLVLMIQWIPIMKLRILIIEDSPKYFPKIYFRPLEVAKWTILEIDILAEVLPTNDGSVHYAEAEPIRTSTPTVESGAGKTVNTTNGESDAGKTVKAANGESGVGKTVNNIAVSSLPAKRLSDESGAGKTVNTKGATKPTHLSMENIPYNAARWVVVKRDAPRIFGSDGYINQPHPNQLRSQFNRGDYEMFRRTNIRLGFELFKRFQDSKLILNF